ncbi:MAG: hypothetical protein MUF30_07870 [Burkholderiales bacterium]|nr:hypothetical protein [Burkholderiales bacterium]
MRRVAGAIALLVAAAPVAAQTPIPVDQEPRHALKFVNRHVRFFDVELPPGSLSLMHVHHHDGVFVNITPSETSAEDWGAPLVQRPARAPGESYFIGYATQPKAHRIGNVGTRPYRVTDTELLSGCGDVALAPDAFAGPLITENARVRVTRVELAPGASTRLHGPCGMLVAVTAGDVRIDLPGGAARITFEPAGFHWRDTRDAVTLTNVGSTPLHAVDILVK